MTRNFCPAGRWSKVHLINSEKLVWPRTAKRSLVALLLPMLVIVLVSAAMAPTLASALTNNNTQITFSPAVNLSNDTGSARYPNVQNSGSHVYVSWTEEARGIKFRSSQNGGVTWNPPLDLPALTLSLAGGITQYPLMLDNGSNVYVVWSQGENASTMEIYEATSTNYGLNFSTPVQLTSGSGGYITPVIASWGNDIYVAYTFNNYGRGSDCSEGGCYSAVTCSSDLGAAGTWTQPFQIGDREPQLAAWGGQYVYAIADWNIWVSANNCATGSWTMHTPQNFLPREPWIWAYGQYVYATWETGSSASIVDVTVSNNYGQNWTTPITLSTTVPDAWAPMVWAYGNSSWIATREYPGGQKGEVWVYTTTNGGETWSTAVPLSGKPTEGTAETFPYTVRSSDGENVFVGWSHQVKPGYWTFMVSYSSNDGSNWTKSPGINVSQNPNGEAGFETDIATGAISSFETNCYATWQFTNGTVDQVYFAYS